MSLLQTGEVWVGIGLLLFVAMLFWLKVPGMMAKALDAKTAAIQHQLDEAQRLRAEAQALLASIQTQREEAEQHAAQMLVDAEDAARRYAEEAKIKLDDQVRRRQQLAERKIASAEVAAAAQVKAAAGEAAADIAERVLAARVGSSKTDPLVDRAIEQLAGKFQ